MGSRKAHERYSFIVIRASLTAFNDATWSRVEHDCAHRVAPWKSDNYMRGDVSRSFMAFLLFWLLAACPTLASGLPTVVDGDPDETIAAAVEAAHSGEKVVIDGEPVASVIVLPDFYERRGLRPAWTSPAVTNELVRAIRESTGDVLSKR